jgi:hypothetical protein
MRPRLVIGLVRVARTARIHRVFRKLIRTQVQPTANHQTA